MKLVARAKPGPVLALIVFTTACASPRVTAVDSPNLAEHQPGRVRLRGVGFRAPLDVSIGGAARRPMFIARPTLGEVTVDGLPAGRHDVTVYRGGREVSRLAGGLVVDSLVATTEESLSHAVQLVGTLSRVDSIVSERLSRAVGKPGPRGLTILKLGPSRASVQSPRRVDRTAVVWLPLDRSCWSTSIDRLLKLPTPLVVKPDGSQFPRCVTKGEEYGLGEIALQRDEILTLLTSEGRITMPVEAIRRPNSVPAFLARHMARVLATVFDPDGQTRWAFAGGRSVYLTPTVVLGTIALSDVKRSGGLSLVVDVACVPDDLSCIAAPSPLYAPLRLMAGAVVPALVGDRTIPLRIDAVHSLDEPVLDEREAPER